MMAEFLGKSFLSICIIYGRNETAQFVEHPDLFKASSQYEIMKRCEKYDYHMAFGNEAGYFYTNKAYPDHNIRKPDF